ncbi:MAG: zf-TFIIB domain-containing protein [Peptococcaceae bacterium]|nr:zf-TFIIB domain-containing protein [Peptococcaceae bacterium]
MKDCPVCAIPMDEVPKSGVLIDVCPRCRGVWLDRGELNRLMESVKAYRDEYEEFYESYRREHDHHHSYRNRYHYKHGHHKKKGFFKMLEEIFD